MAKRLYNQPTAAPTNKVAAGFNWGIVTILLAFFVKSIWGIELPQEVSMSLTVLIASIAAYYTRDQK